jgi:predicted RecB family endonuclease
MTGDFQARSGREGARFEDFCARLLRGSGFTILGTHVAFDDLGIDVDYEIENRHGVRFFVECKGGRRDRAGAQRTDNVRKAVATGALMKLADPAFTGLVILTTRRAVAGLRSDRMIEAATKYGALRDVIAIEEDDPAEDLARLDALAEARS